VRRLSASIYVVRPLTPTLSPSERGEWGRDHVSSDTCPSGKPNSNVFSVIDTIV